MAAGPFEGLRHAIEAQFERLRAQLEAVNEADGLVEASRRCSGSRTVHFLASNHLLQLHRPRAANEP
jgi:hypothetical protein